jgi:hypothetical protein
MFGYFLLERRSFLESTVVLGCVCVFSSIFCANTDRGDTKRVRTTENIGNKEYYS